MSQFLIDNIIASSGINLNNLTIPSSADDPGIAGDIVWDSNYVYVCTATDTWKRAALDGSAFGTAWTQVGADIDGEAAEDKSGWSIAMSSDGSRVAIGAKWNDGNGVDAGHVRVYDLVGSTWTQVGADIDGEAAVDLSGWSIAMSSDGSRIAIGSYINDGNGINAGHVRVFDLVGSTWTQVGSDIDGEEAGDSSGWSIAMSSDGSRIAIGAYNDNTECPVRVYDLVGSTWTQVGGDIDGEAAGDYNGISVAMSSDGSRVAIGAYYNDDGGTDAGHVRVYDWT